VIKTTTSLQKFDGTSKTTENQLGIALAGRSYYTLM